MSDSLPKLEKPAYFATECYYPHQGLGHLNILMHTDIDVENLLQTDLRGYIQFVDQHLSAHFDYKKLNPVDHHEISAIGEIERGQDESLDQFITRFMATLDMVQLKNIQETGALPISVNRVKPSKIDGISRLSADEAEWFQKVTTTIRLSLN